MTRALAVAALFTLASVSALAADTKMTVKAEKAEPPKELSAAVRGTLSDQSLKVLDDKGELLCTVWPVKALDTKATAAAGLKYSQVEETTVVGAVQFSKEWKDYRKQKLKPGVYTLRLATQPMDGDHMGTAPYNEFCLLCPAATDTKPELLEVEAAYKLSAKSVGGKHPAMMLLFPLKTPPGAPAVEAKPKDHFVLSYRVPATAAKEKTVLGFSLVVVGVSASE